MNNNGLMFFFSSPFLYVVENDFATNSYTYNLQIPKRNVKRSSDLISCSYKDFTAAECCHEPLDSYLTADFKGCLCF